MFVQHDKGHCLPFGVAFMLHDEQGWQLPCHQCCLGIRWEAAQPGHPGRV